MKFLFAAFIGLITMSNLLSLLFADDLDCDCLEDLKEIDV